MKRVLVCLVIMVFSVSVMGATINVPGDQPTIQAGIDTAVDGDTVLVASGTYVENINFLGKAITVISNMGPDVTIIDGSSPPDPDLGSVVTFESGEGPDSVLEGFTVTNGTGTKWGTDIYFGGGIYIGGQSSPIITGNIISGNTCPGNSSGGGILVWMSSSPTITDNTIIGNAANDGGGIHCNNSTPTITNNIISENTAEFLGGGVSFAQTDSAITHCTIKDNISDDSGGGICGINSSLAVQNCTVTGNYAARWGGGIGAGSNSNETMVVSNCTVNGNSSARWAGGVAGDNMFMTISDNEISGNSAQSDRGGGIYAYGNCTGTITNNIIFGNETAIGGGGIILWIGCSMDIINNLVFDNHATGSGAQGGGISCTFNCTAFVNNTTICANSASTNGGGISCEKGSLVIVKNTILWENEAGTSADEIFIGSAANPSTVTIDYSDVRGGQDYILVHPNNILNWGEGMIDRDPLFCDGPPGGDHCGYYLANESCSAPANSPCLEAGDPMSQLVQGANRTDLVQDWGVVDMGFHYPREIQAYVVAGPGPDMSNPPLVGVFPPERDADHFFEFSAYGASSWGVNVACGELNANGMCEVLTGAGSGDIYGPHVRGFEADGTPLPGLSFLAYGTNKYGVNVAAGDIDADGFDEIITGAGPGAVFGPHVRGWNYDGTPGVEPVSGVSYFAYGTPKWGVNVAAGDIDGDGFDEIITGAGPGAVYGPHVRGWNVDGAAAVPIPGVSFFAYGTNQYGVNVTCGDVDGDGMDEIVTGPGPGPMFATHVRGWNYDGEVLSEISSINFIAWSTSGPFYGANVSSRADLNGDGRAELVVGCGPDPAASTEVKVFTWDGTTVSEWCSLEAFPGMRYGVNVAAGRF